MSDLAARVFSASGALFKDLKPGERFRFAPGDAVLKKTSNRRYSNGTRTFETGARSAVLREGA